MIVFEMEIVGGAFDGTPGLMWRGDRAHPSPDLILLGVCGKGRDCGSSACKPAKAHVSYWTPEEMDRPADAMPYAKQDEFVVPGGDGGLRGRTVYAVGGLLDPRNFGAAARTPVTA